MPHSCDPEDPDDAQLVQVGQCWATLKRPEEADAREKAQANLKPPGRNEASATGP